MENTKLLCTSQEQYEYAQNLDLQENTLVPTCEGIFDLRLKDEHACNAVLSYIFKRLFGELENSSLLILCCLFDVLVDEVVYLEVIQAYLKTKDFDSIATLLTFKDFENTQVYDNLIENLTKKNYEFPFYKTASLEKLLVKKQQLRLPGDVQGKYVITSEAVKALPTFEEPKLAEKPYVVVDMTNKTDVDFQKKIYLILKGSLSGDEAAHKLIKLKITDAEKKVQAVDVLVKACSHEQSYSKYYGIMSELLCQFHKSWGAAFSTYFCDLYSEYIESYEPNQLRNVGKFYGHLFASDFIGFENFKVIHMNEEQSSSCSRIFVKFLFNELVLDIGISSLKERLGETYIQPFLCNLFPMENVDHMRFSINFFTVIKLGALTEKMRARLAEQVHEKTQPRSSVTRRRSLSPIRPSKET